MGLTDFDRLDVVMGGGLLLATTGIAMLSVPYALITLGGTLFGLGCVGLWRRRK